MEPKEEVLVNKRWEILTENGFKPFSGIKKSSQRNVQKTMVLGVEVKCTPDHKFLVDGQWIEAKELPHESLAEKEDVYDALDVADGNHYLTNGVTSHNCLFLDEFAHVENHVADEFFTSVFPTLSSGKETKILMSSTPNGYNMFYKFWTDAEKGINGFIHQRFDWWEHPERDQKWADEQKAVLGELKYTQEVGMEFLGSSKTLLTGETLRALAYRNPDFQHAKGEYKGLKIYEKPDVDRKYVMTVDVSRGRHLDSSAFGIFDVTEYPHKIVATYNNADIAPLMYSAICYNMAKKYNDAYILVEINDIGGQVAEEIYYTYEYGEMFWTKTGDVLGKQGADDYPGIRTTKKTKRIGCANLKDIIEKKQLIVDDWQMIQELATFVQSDSGNWEADEGFRDDSVAVLWLFAWLVMQPWFSDLTDKDIRSRMYSDKVREMEDELMPPTIITSQDWINEESPEYLGLRELL